jgi:ribosomal protein L31
MDLDGRFEWDADGTVRSLDGAHNTIDSVKLSSAELDQIAVTYPQLFLSKNTVTKNGVSPRKNEAALFERQGTATCAACGSSHDCPYNTTLEVCPQCHPFYVGATLVVYRCVREYTVVYRRKRLSSPLAPLNDLTLNQVLS